MPLKEVNPQRQFTDGRCPAGPSTAVGMHPIWTLAWASMGRKLWTYLAAAPVEAWKKTLGFTFDLGSKHQQLGRLPPEKTSGLRLFSSSFKIDSNYSQTHQAPVPNKKSGSAVRLRDAVPMVPQVWAVHSSSSSSWSWMACSLTIPVVPGMKKLFEAGMVVKTVQTNPCPAWSDWNPSGLSPGSHGCGFPQTPSTLEIQSPSKSRLQGSGQSDGSKCSLNVLFHLARQLHTWTTSSWLAMAWIWYPDKWQKSVVLPALSILGHHRPSFANGFENGGSDPPFFAINLRTSFHPGSKCQTHQLIDKYSIHSHVPTMNQLLDVSWLSRIHTSWCLDHRSLPSPKYFTLNLGHL